jgi:hypothetical protein
MALTQTITGFFYPVTVMATYIFQYTNRPKVKDDQTYIDGNVPVDLVHVLADSVDASVMSLDQHCLYAGWKLMPEAYLHCPKGKSLWLIGFFFANGKRPKVSSKLKQDCGDSFGDGLCGSAANHVHGHCR